MNRIHKLKIAESVKKHWNSINGTKQYRDRCNKMSLNRLGIPAWNKNMAGWMSDESKQSMIQKKKGKRRSIATEFKKGRNEIPWNKGMGTKKRYRQIKINEKKVYKHTYNYCMFYDFPCMPYGYEIHHMNKDPSDNRIQNLLLVTPQEHRTIFHGEQLNGR